MADSNRNILDDLVEGARQILDEIDRMLNPDKRRKPVPVPVPVRSRPDRDDPRYPSR